MTPEEFFPEWERCAPYLRAALDYSHDSDLNTLCQMVLRGDAQFWPAVDAAMLTELDSSGTNLHVRLYGGTLERLREMLPSIEAFGRALGCTGITFTGRRGWERVAFVRDRDYYPIATLMRKDLSHEFRIEENHHQQ